METLEQSLPYGDWIVGDSHDYSQDARPFNAESVDSLMLDLSQIRPRCVSGSRPRRWIR